MDLAADLKAHRPPGGCMMAYPTNPPIGRPCHKRCTPRAHDSPWAGDSQGTLLALVGARMGHGRGVCRRGGGGGQGEGEAHHNAHAPDIPGLRAVPLQRLGAHVVQCAGGAALLQFACAAEVPQFAEAAALDQHVLGLDVAVQDLMAVQVTEALRSGGGGGGDRTALHRQVCPRAISGAGRIRQGRGEGGRWSPFSEARPPPPRPTRPPKPTGGGGARLRTRSAPNCLLDGGPPWGKGGGVVGAS